MINADVWKDFGNIIEYDATGIDKVTNRSDVKEISRYSLNGQRVTSPTKGVNIVVYSDGGIKKVAVQKIKKKISVTLSSSTDFFCSLHS